jgi:hypothetical protein
MSDMQGHQNGVRSFATRRAALAARLADVAAYVRGKILDPQAIVPVLELLIRRSGRTRG